jgi:serine/threonine protein kinase
MRQPRAGKHRIPFSFLLALRMSGLLSTEQLDQVNEAATDLDLTALSQELLESGWLTRYQLKRIQDGQPRGLILGPYRILDFLGQGGFGTVYKALHGLTDRVVALKTIASSCLTDADGRKLFLREVVIATRLNHPNIALAYDANETDGTLWFAMEHVTGPDLHTFVSDHNPLPVLRVCAVISQVARALQYAHENGLVHRDIKPANLLLTATGVSDSLPLSTGPENALVKVVDFGFVRLRPGQRDHPDTLCAEGGWLGTPEFMSPEQAKDSRFVDIRSDLYSLGCTFYYALTARYPFAGTTATETIALHLEAAAPALSSLRPDVPADLEDLIKRLMHKDPDQRFQTPGELVEALAYFLRNNYLLVRPSSSGPPIPPVPVPPDPAEATQGVAENAVGLSGSRPTVLAVPAESPALAAALLPSRLERVSRLWTQWLSVVEACLKDLPSEIDDERYKMLYLALTTDLHQGTLETEAGSEQLYANLEAVVQPWLTRQSLSRLDRKSLAGLWQAGRQLQAEFTPVTGKAFGFGFLFLFLVFGALLFLVFQWVVR